jgi:hypothetical protein
MEWRRRNRWGLRTGLLLAALLCVTEGVEAAAAVDRLDIVDQSIAFHGGAKYARSSTELKMCSKSGCYELRSRILGGLFDLEVQGPAGQHQRRARITNNEVELWVDGKAVGVSKTDELRIRSWVMARIYFVFLPFRLNDPSTVKQDLGSETWHGRTLRKVKISFVAGSSPGADDEFLYWFDPQSGRLEQFAYSFSGNPGGLRFRRGFNYRRVGDILFFDQENRGIEGRGLTVDQISPEAVAEWPLISTVVLEEIQVQDLESAMGEVDQTGSRGFANRPSSSNCSAACCMAASTLAP